MDHKKIIFVFGSNTAGRHGKGAAKTALFKYEAIYGKGTGLQGYSYAIPTKDNSLKVLDLDSIAVYVNEFLVFAANHPDYLFKVTRVGCGLAGYKNEDIAPMFRQAPQNCEFDPEWSPWGLKPWIQAP